MVFHLFKLTWKVQPFTLVHIRSYHGSAKRQNLWNFIALDDDTSDDDFDEDFTIRRPRWLRERIMLFDLYDETDFAVRFRLSKAAVLFVLEKIEPALEFPTDKNFSVSPINQTCILCALRFYATGSTQLACADFGGFSKSTAHRIIHRVSSAIAALHAEFITFPDTVEEVKRQQLDFFRIAQFPKAIGLIDCTHIKIQSPGGPNAEIFRNRKHYFSINVQVICNAQLKISDIEARWQGSAHDSHIFNNCYRKCRLEQNDYGDAVIIGDSGYACTSYLMTPLDNPISPQENLYNASQIKTRNAIERLFGIWKRRFPVLALGLKVKLDKTLTIITATAVLQNILREMNETVPPDDAELELPEPWESWDELLAAGMMNNERAVEDPPRQNSNHRRRRDIIENYFQSLL